MKKRFRFRLKGLFSLLLLPGLFLSLQSCGEGGRPDYLILVNKTHPIPEDYIRTVELTELENVSGGVCQAEKQTRDAFLLLKASLLKKGVEIGADSGYRSVEYQEELMERFIRDYGEEYARNTVAVPGTSEHHTGLVIDIVPKINGEWVTENEDMLPLTDVFAVIHASLPEYGFILRYPEGKKDVTGYDYEPWHLRYVGRKAAYEIYENGLTLEEYAEQNRRQDG